MRTDRPRMTIEPDTKDWTWVLSAPCPECLFEAGSVGRGALGAAIRDDADRWTSTLADPRAAQRPSPTTWSPVEYACHVRDVNLVMVRRVRSMLETDDPVFDNWDQDRTATEDGYDRAIADEVRAELEAAADAAAALYDSLRGDEAAWSRPGRRSNGSLFTVESLGRYHLHDLVHHQYDVRWLAEGRVAKGG